MKLTETSAINRINMTAATIVQSSKSQFRFLTTLDSHWEIVTVAASP